MINKEMDSYAIFNILAKVNKNMEMYITSERNRD